MEPHDGLTTTRELRQGGPEPTFGSALAFSAQDVKRRVIVYIDGFNLYYGLVKGTLWKWFDLVAQARSLCRKDGRECGIADMGENQAVTNVVRGPRHRLLKSTKMDDFVSA